MNLWNSGFLFNGGASSSSNGIYSLLSEYNNIRSGAYYKVVKAYYAKQSGTDTKTDTKNSTGTTRGRTGILRCAVQCEGADLFGR